MTSGERKADVVADDLLRRIVSGELPVGSLLPREAELAARYHVNRGVVREAIKLLEVHRLVRPKRRRGTEVLDPLASLSPEVLRAMLLPRGGSVDAGVLADLLELRTLIDCEIATQAALRRTDADLERLDACVAAMKAALGDPVRYSDALNALALALAHATHNRLFQMLVHWHARVVVDLGDVLLSARQPSEQHVQGVTLLVDLVRAQQSEAVRELVSAFHRFATPNALAVAAAQEPPGEALTREGRARPTSYSEGKVSPS